MLETGNHRKFIFKNYKGSNQQSSSLSSGYPLEKTVQCAPYISNHKQTKQYSLILDPDLIRFQKL